jgi:hypothetical protein
MRITAVATFAQLYEQRFSPELPTDAVELLPYKRTQAEVGIEYQPALLGIELAVGFARFRYGSVTTLSEGEVSWEDLNRDIIIPRARVSYEFQPGYAAYVEGVYEQREFDLAVDRSGLDRSSNGYRVRTGLATALTNLLLGEAFVGYLDQRYAEPLEDLSGFDFGASLTWSVTALTTVRLNAQRVINDTAIEGVSGLDDRTLAFSVDHELLRNLVLRSNLGYLHSRFQGVARADEVVDFGFGAEYFMSRYLSVSARYAHQRRTSDNEGQGFNDNLVSVAIRGQL